MCKICKGKDKSCDCRGNFTPSQKGKLPKKSLRTNRIINQKGAF